jgi:hypothetical protein
MVHGGLHLCPRGLGSLFSSGHTPARMYAQSLQGHQSPVDSVTFDHNEELVAAGAASGSIKIFDLDQAKGRHYT